MGMNQRATAVVGWACVLAVLGACGGGESPSASPPTLTTQAQRSGAAQASSTAAPEAGITTTQLDAVRLTQQAAFGPTEALVTEIRTKGVAQWLSDQVTMTTNLSRYTSGGDDRIHTNNEATDYCSLPATRAQMDQTYCYREFHSAEPLVRDFYRDALNKPDQLRQRMALALGQILVLSSGELKGTYGMRNYHNALLAGAFGNYRDVLRKVILSPVMGDYLDHVDNDPIEPNENFGRELLQLFTIGPCQLLANGQLPQGRCTATYDNDKVRNYAYALTGWTYPRGGVKPWCKGPPDPRNCQYYGGDMVAAPGLRDAASRSLLSGVTVPAGSTSAQALELVLNSLMAHPNTGPFIGYRLIQQLVMSNPRPTYVARVSAAFDSGRFNYGGRLVGSGVKGDLTATVAAVLLDADARSETMKVDTGFMRQPALHIAGVLRAFNGITDGARFGQYWGVKMQQQMFRPPSVFNFYPPNFPVAGTNLVGPEFGIVNPTTLFEHLNYLTTILDRGGIPYTDTCAQTPIPATCVPGGTGTSVRFSAFSTTTSDAPALVDRLSQLLLGANLPEPQRQSVIDAVSWWNVDRDAGWRDKRTATAAYLVLASPDYQVQR